jgi:hypothetical protein
MSRREIPRHNRSPGEVVSPFSGRLEKARGMGHSTYRACSWRISILAEFIMDDDISVYSAAEEQSADVEQNGGSMPDVVVLSFHYGSLSFTSHPMTRDRFSVQHFSASFRIPSVHILSQSSSTSRFHFAG